MFVRSGFIRTLWDALMSLQTREEFRAQINGLSNERNHWRGEANRLLAECNRLKSQMSGYYVGEEDVEQEVERGDGVVYFEPRAAQRHARH